MGCAESNQREDLLNPEKYQFFRHEQIPYEIWREMKHHTKECRNRDCQKVNEYHTNDQYGNQSKYTQMIQIGNHHYDQCQNCPKAVKLNQKYKQLLDQFTKYKNKGQIKYRQGQQQLYTQTEFITRKPRD